MPEIIAILVGVGLLLLALVIFTAGQQLGDGDGEDRFDRTQRSFADLASPEPTSAAQEVLGDPMPAPTVADVAPPHGEADPQAHGLAAERLAEARREADEWREQMRRYREERAERIRQRHEAMRRSSTAMHERLTRLSTGWPTTTQRSSTGSRNAPSSGAMSANQDARLGERVRIEGFTIKAPRMLELSKSSTLDKNRWRGSGPYAGVGMDIVVRDLKPKELEQFEPVMLVGEQSRFYAGLQPITTKAAPTDHFIAGLNFQRVELPINERARKATCYYVAFSDDRTKHISITLRYQAGQPEQLKILESAVKTLEPFSFPDAQQEQPSADE